MSVETFANTPSTTVSSGGTTAPSAGTQETWTVVSSTPFSGASSSATPPTQFHVVDPNAPTEWVKVINVSGTTWTVIRGSEGTPVAHTGGFTIVQVVTAAVFSSFAQANEVQNVFNVKAYGATGNGSTDDTTAVQNAMTAAGVAGGVLYFPTGSYLLTPAGSTPALTYPTTGYPVKMMGDGAGASILIKNANGILVRMSGLYNATPGGSHLTFCSMENIGMNGNLKTGLLLEMYYNDNSYVSNVHMTSNSDLCIDGVELWDSRFYNLACESSNGTANSTSQPNVWLRNTSTASVGAYGYSYDCVNQIHFVGCRFEAFGTGALWITQGTAGTSAPNGFYVTNCKFESSLIQGGPQIWVDSSVVHAVFQDLYCYAGGFASGYSTAQNFISWSPIYSVLANVFIGNGSYGTIAAGVDVTSIGSVTVMRDVVGRYNTNPTVAHVNYETSSGDFFVEGTFANSGTQVAGTVPANNWPTAPLRRVAGAVTDSSFLHTPVDGTMALDTTDSKLYVRVGGTWKSVTVA